MGNYYACCPPAFTDYNHIQAVLARYKCTGVLHYDQEFPPTNETLYEESKCPKILKLVTERQISWIRAEQIPELNASKEGTSIFGDTIEHFDIQRAGILGDSWLLTVLISVALHPERVQAIFETTEVNAAGAYSVNLYTDGTRKAVVVDSYLPCLGMTPCLSGSKLWVVVLQKAWAKSMGSYQRPYFASFVHTFHDLLGAPTYQYKVSQKSITTIVEADADGYLMAATIFEGEDKVSKKNRPLGLSRHHPYALMGVFTVIDQQGEAVRLLKLRNPNSKVVWRGSWGPQSSCWTDRLREEVGISSLSEDTFCMTFDDFLQ